MYLFSCTGRLFSSLSPTTENNGTITTNYNTKCAFRMEKPKMLKFSGRCKREFSLFKADFKHMVDVWFSKRDAIAYNSHSMPTRLSVRDDKRICQDFDAAWEYLCNFADTIIQDIP